MQVDSPARGMTGDPLIFGTAGREAAFGLPGLTAPGMPGCVAPGAVPVRGMPVPMPVVPEGDGVAGATLGDGEPPGWVGAVPVPVGEDPTWAYADTARRLANPAANTIFEMDVMG